MSSSTVESYSPATTAVSAAPTSSLVVYSAALLSGTAALIYELIWSKMLALTFGSTTLSTSAVVAGFMGGMGIGAWGYHFIAQRDKVKRAHPLAVYGYLEVGIAITTALVTMTMYGLPELFVGWAAVVDSDLVLSISRFAFVFVLLLVPAALMGATFPALCTVMIDSARGVDRHLGFIYGLNTVGAACGALVAGVVLVDSMGLKSAVSVANVINLVVGMGCLLSARGRRDQTHATDDHEQTAIATAMPRLLTAVILFVSGFATLAYEIMGLRALRYLGGNSTYARTVVFVVFLLGLGLGALLLRPIARRGRAEADLAASQIGIAALALVAVTLLTTINSPPEAMRSYIDPIRENVSIFAGAYGNVGWMGRLTINGLLALVLLLPATLLMGLSFPLASRLFLGDVRLLGRRVGGAYLLSNLGSISGAILAGTWLLPTFGTLGGSKLVATLNLALGLLTVIWVARAGQRATLGTWTIVATGIAATIGLGIALPAQMPLRGEPGAYDRADVVFTLEGDLSTVHVLVDPVRPSKRAVAIDGSVIGATETFSKGLHAKQQVLAHLPLAIDRRLRRSLNIGLGSGSTLEALARYPTIEVLDCVEINQGVVDAAREYFPEGAVLDDPRVRLHVEDAVHYLLGSATEYDVIISDGKQNPMFPGNASILCEEFYDYALKRLSDEGLFVQWMPVSTLSSELAIVLRTFVTSFPQVAVFFFPDNDVLMVGARQPLAGRPHLDAATFEGADGPASLAWFRIDRPEQLLAYCLADGPQLATQLGPAPVATWDHNVIEFTTIKASRPALDRAAAENVLLFQAASMQPRGDRPWLANDVNPATRRSTELIQEAYASVVRETRDDYLVAFELARQAVETDPENRAAELTLERMELVLKSQQIPVPEH